MTALQAARVRLLEYVSHSVIEAAEAGHGGAPMQFESLQVSRMLDEVVQAARRVGSDPF